MQVNGNLDFKGVGKLVRPGVVEADFPANPTVGEIVLKNKKLYICADVVDGLPYWVTLVNELALYRHDQSSTALEWTINHNMNTNIVNVQVYDANGLWVIPDAINCSQSNRTTISFSMPVAGVALISSGDTEGLPKTNYAFTETFTNSASWVVVHNLGYNPVITTIVNNYVVQPLTIVHDSLLQATVTFSTPQTGTVRCV